MERSTDATKKVTVVTIARAYRPSGSLLPGNITSITQLTHPYTYNPSTAPRRPLQLYNSSTSCPKGGHYMQNFHNSCILTHAFGVCNTVFDCAGLYLKSIYIY